MSGKCICKPGIIGDKCDICPDGTPVTPKGCNGCKIESVFHVQTCTAQMARMSQFGELPDWFCQKLLKNAKSASQIVKIW